jgi:hypothetical protein
MPIIGKAYKRATHKKSGDFKIGVKFLKQLSCPNPELFSYLSRELYLSETGRKAGVMINTQSYTKCT